MLKVKICEVGILNKNEVLLALCMHCPAGSLEAGVVCCPIGRGEGDLIRVTVCGTPNNDNPNVLNCPTLIHFCFQMENTSVYGCSNLPAIEAPPYFIFCNRFYWPPSCGEPHPHWPCSDPASLLPTHWGLQVLWGADRSQPWVQGHLLFFLWPPSELTPPTTCLSPARLDAIILIIFVKQFPPFHHHCKVTVLVINCQQFKHKPP